MLNADFHHEQLLAKDQMMEMTTNYLIKVQSELEQKNRYLSEAHETISGSIRFAELIQKSFLPEEQLLSQHFAQSAYFICQQAGIGGDAIFVRKNENGILFGLFDSTGHGVPAAILSISTTLLLEELFLKFPAGETDLILHHLNNRLFTTFKNEVLNIAQVEGTLFFYNFKKKNIFYSSAKGKAGIIRTNGLYEELDPGVTPAGYEYSSQFEIKKISLREGDRLLLHSDGLTDQFGGIYNKKFTRARLRKLLTQHTHMSVQELKELIVSEHRLWKNANEQTDDISLLILQI